MEWQPIIMLWWQTKDISRPVWECLKKEFPTQLPLSLETWYPRNSEEYRRIISIRDPQAFLFPMILPVGMGYFFGFKEEDLQIIPHYRPCFSLQRQGVELERMQL